MSMNSDYSLSDIAAASGNRQNDGLFGGNGAIWLIVLFLFVFCGWGGNWCGGNRTGASITGKSE